MNISHLNYFLTLVEYKNYTKASKKLYISQPALSKAIKILEDELGVSLFKKAEKEIHLTMHGKIFYGYAKNSISILDNGIKQLKMLSKKSKDNIKIGSVYSCVTQCVPLSILEFRKKFPNITFNCKENISPNIVEDLINSQIDLGLIYDPITLQGKKNIEIIKLFDYKVFLAVPKSHKLAKFTTINYNDIIDEPFISYTENTANFKIFRKEITSYKLPYPKNIIIRCNNESSVISSIEKGLGIGLISTPIFNNKLNIHLLTFEDIFFSLPIYMIWRNDIILSSAVISYKDYILRAHHLESFLK